MKAIDNNDENNITNKNNNKIGNKMHFKALRKDMLAGQII